MKFGAVPVTTNTTMQDDNSFPDNESPVAQPPVGEPAASGEAGDGEGAARARGRKLRTPFRRRRGD
ncbi:23S rRNA pseudouridylate synthase B, partial [Bordetella bronchiseptica]